VLIVHTDPLLCFTHRCSHNTNTLGVTFYIQVGRAPVLARASVRLSGCWILHTLYVWCFTTGVINLVSESSQNRTRSFRFFPFSHIHYRPFPPFPRVLPVAQVLRYKRIMEATQSYPNLLSEKQAAKRLDVARITLLRAREAGRIRFFRIGTRVLYCAEHLTDFLNNCERNAPRTRGQGKTLEPRKENTRSGRGRVSERGSGRSLARRRSRRLCRSPFFSSAIEGADLSCRQK
jgi:hypothetical protein